MSLSKEILDHIEAKTSRVIGTDAFLGFIPEDNKTGLAVLDIGGDENDTNLLRHALQVQVSADDYLSAENGCWEIHELLNYSNGITLGDGGYVFNIVPLSNPKYIGLNEYRKPTFAATMVVLKAR